MAQDGVEGARDGHDRGPSMAAEDHVMMTPRGQGLHAGVGQGSHAPEVERRVPPIASGPVEVGGKAIHPGPQRLQ